MLLLKCLQPRVDVKTFFLAVLELLLVPFDDLVFDLVFKVGVV
jgi:hypothetical protein